MELEKEKARSILHVTVGIPGQWEPTAEELEDIKNLFESTLDDPKGTVVATRTGIDARVLPIQGEPTLEVVRQQVGNNPEMTNTTLSIDMPPEEMLLLAQRIGVTRAKLEQADIRDANGNMLRHVQFIDLATGEAVLNISIELKDENVTYSPAMRIIVGNTLEPITAHANLSGCWLTFPSPGEGELGYKPKRIPIESLRNNTKPTDIGEVSK